MLSGTDHRQVELAVVAADRAAQNWRRQIEQELTRIDHLSTSAIRADALIVIVDKTFPQAIRRAATRKSSSYKAIRDALAAGKMLLPLGVENSSVPDPEQLPEDIRGLTEFQALALDRVADLPGVVARLIVATKTGMHPYRPAKMEDRRVFISYRRDDSWYWAALLARSLTQRLGAHNVFFDIGSIAPGRRFDKEIQSRIEDSTDFVILVGVTFLGVDQKGRRRLDEPKDFVRREIRAAIGLRKIIHVVLAGGATMPDTKQLPGDIKPPFEQADPLSLADFRDADGVAATILATLAKVKFPKPIRLLPRIGRSQFLTPQQKAERFIIAAVPPLAALGWRAVDPVKTKGVVMMTRPGAQDYRFVFDFENHELILEEYARGIRGLGFKRWIKRSIFPVVPDAADIDVLRTPDRQVEAMDDPAAFLNRVGRMDLDMGSRPPMSAADVARFLRPSNQPGQRALDQNAQQRGRIRAHGGLRALQRIRVISLGEIITAHAVRPGPDARWIFAASNNGAYLVDIQRGTVTRTALHSALLHIDVTANGQLAAALRDQRLSVMDSTGLPVVRRIRPYSAWQRLRIQLGEFKSVSWSADEKRIAIGASDRIWIYQVDDDQFAQVPLQRDGYGSSAMARFISGSDDLLILHFSTIWRASSHTGKILHQYDIGAGSDYFEPTAKVYSARPAGLRPDCLALSPDAKKLAIGGNDAQIAFFDAATLEPLGMQVWHAPLVDGGINGTVRGLAYSPDGRWLASVANDNRLVVGDARTGDCLADGIVTQSSMWQGDVCWSRDGSRIVVANGEGKLEIWDSTTVS